MTPTLDLLPCGFLTFADDGTVRQANQTLLDLLALPADEVVGRHIEAIFTVGGRIFYQTHFYPLLKMKGRVEEVYLALLTAAGGEVPVLVNATRAERDGETLNDCIFVAMRQRSQYEDEILKAKRESEAANQAKDRANAELERLRDRLEEQVEQRTIELRTAVEDMQGFSYAIAHDLRAPLRAIVSTSEVLREEAAHLLTPGFMELLARQSFNGRKLSSLVDDLLRFAALGRASISRQAIDVSQIASNLVRGLESRTFIVEPGMEATGDPVLVRTLLENLIDNAVKYSPDGGEIHVGTLPGEESTFFVRDLGIGFDLRYASKIFLPFERLHLEGEYSGNGIGLALVRRIVERHRGRVWVESEPGQGATFLFSLG